MPKAFVLGLISTFLITIVLFAPLPVDAAPRMMSAAAQEDSAKRGLVRDFSLKVSPAVVSVVTDSLAKATVYVNRTLGPSDPITLSYASSLPQFYCSDLPVACLGAWGDPNAVACSFAPSILDSRRLDTSTLSCLGLPGTYNVTVTATSTQTSHATSLLIFVESPPFTISVVSVHFLPSFSVSAPASFTIDAGDYGIVPITVYSAGANVSLSVNAPSSLSCNLDQTRVPLSGGSGNFVAWMDINLTCRGSTVGDFPVNVIAYGGTGTITSVTPITVHVVSTSPAPTPSVRSPATILGLNPTIFYGAVIGIVLLLAVVGAILVLRRKK